MHQLPTSFAGMRSAAAAGSAASIRAMAPILRTWRGRAGGGFLALRSQQDYAPFHPALGISAALLLRSGIQP
jgi:hypothetical protein